MHLGWPHMVWPSFIELDRAGVHVWDFPGGSDGKVSSTMRETWVQSLGREDILEKETATHSSILAWKIPWMEEPGRLLQVHGVAKSRTRLSEFTHMIGEGNSSPLQYSCLENPMDGGAW